MRLSSLYLRFAGWIFLIVTAFFLIMSILYYIFSVSISQLNDVKLETPLRIYTQDEYLIAEFGEHKRIPVTFSQIPTQLINAFMSAEDVDFYTNNGVQFRSLLRAAWSILTTGHIQSGGSTITMQVARNFFLNSDRVFSRKLKEIILALKMTHYLSKNDIMTLYLNKIYLGNRAYGIESAAQVYYGKSIDSLNLAQMAMIASLPKAPSAYNPLNNQKRALQRRDWILSRMLALKFITLGDYTQAIQQPITAKYHAAKVQVYAPHLAEMVRQSLLKQYGKGIYTEGYQIYTTITKKAQNLAESVILKGLTAYDHKQIYQGPVQQKIPPKQWESILNKTANISHFKPAIITQINHNSIQLLLKSNQTGTLLWTHLPWYFMKTIKKYTSKVPATPHNILAVGDLIWVQESIDKTYKLAQIPDIQAVLISMNTQTGAIQSLIGGFNFNQSHFNRATSAYRQVGSLIKPFIYSAALAKGMTAATLINDSPIVLNNLETDSYWRPHNEDNNFKGFMRLRQGLYQSRNLISIRILEKIGIQYARRYLTQFGFDNKALTDYLSLALGAVNITPMQLITAYAMLANSGYLLQPYWINRIVLPDHRVIEMTPPILAHQNSSEPKQKHSSEETALPTTHRSMCPRINYIINSILKDVVQLGTARKALVLKRKDLAGKTGTTNQHKDVWFVGFNPAIVTLVWLGKDNGASLGYREFGASLALPIWLNYMKPILEPIPNIEQKIPNNMITKKINKHTGEFQTTHDADSIFEIFRTEQVPQQKRKTDILSHIKPIALEDLF